MTIAKLGYTLLGLFIVWNWGFLMGAIFRKIGARVSGRIGIPFYQPWINFFKSVGVRTTITHGVMYYLGPVFRLTGGIGLLFFMPLIYTGDPNGMWTNFSFEGDLILILYFQLFGMLGMAMGAGEGGHPYSAMGIARGLAQHAAVELPLTLAILSIAIQYDTFSMYKIVEAQQGGFQNWVLFTNPFAAGAIILAMLGAMGHSPFNLVKAPNEILIGPATEYEGTYLGFMQSAGSILHVMEAVLFMNLVFGGATSWPELIVKTFLIYFWSVFVGMVFPRYKIEQSITWFFKVPLVLGVLAIIVFSF
ncbi:MAG: NADH-quinone oxidoreductase subunit H [Chlorobi bacterium]|nr:NADH-quinone oxidoreductase subunit H [Chlorobiota bacterium]